MNFKINESVYVLSNYVGQSSLAAIKVLYLLNFLWWHSQTKLVRAKTGGERGIRTLAPGFPDSCLAGKRFRPLSHLSDVIPKGYCHLPFFQVT